MQMPHPLRDLLVLLLNPMPLLLKLFSRLFPWEDHGGFSGAKKFSKHAQFEMMVQKTRISDLNISRR